MAVSVHGIHVKDGITIKAAGLIAADTESAAVFVGRGLVLYNFVWTACEIATGDEFYNMQLQFNTAAATSTWLDGPNIAFGASSLLGGAAATSATGDFVIAVFNPGDHQVRVNNWVTGTIATGINCVVTAYPVIEAPF